jgi:hypothetical protein
MMAVVGVLKTDGRVQLAVGRLIARSGGDPTVLLTMLIWFNGLLSAICDNVTTVIFVFPMALEVAAVCRLKPAALLLPMVIASNIGGAATLIGDPPNILIGSGAGALLLDFTRESDRAGAVDDGGVRDLSRRYFRAALLAAVPVDAAVIDDRIANPELLRWGLIIRPGLRRIPDSRLDGNAGRRPGGDRRGDDPRGAGRPAQPYHALSQQERGPRHPGGHRERDRVAPHSRSSPFCSSRSERQWRPASSTPWPRAGYLHRGGRTAWGSRPRDRALRGGADPLGQRILSALIDNIPYVAVAIPIIARLVGTFERGHRDPLVGIGAGGLPGGNGTVIGASANVTVTGLAERAGHTISFREFARFGSGITAITLLISTAFITLHCIWSAADGRAGAGGAGGVLRNSAGERGAGSGERERERGAGSGERGAGSGSGERGSGERGAGAGAGERPKRRN